MRRIRCLRRWRVAPRRRRHEETGLKVVRRPTDMSRADPLWLFFFHWTIPSKGKERHTDAACLVCSCVRKQAAGCKVKRRVPWSEGHLSVARQEITNIWKIVLFVRESLKYAAAFFTSFRYVYCAVMVFKIQSIWRTDLLVRVPLFMPAPRYPKVREHMSCVTLGPVRIPRHLMLKTSCKMLQVMSFEIHWFLKKVNDI